MKSKKEEFIDNIGKIVYFNLNAAQKAELLRNPDPYAYHYSLGMYIRNKYIYGMNLNFPCAHIDDLSVEITGRVIELVAAEAG